MGIFFLKKECPKFAFVLYLPILISLLLGRKDSSLENKFCFPL